MRLARIARVIDMAMPARLAAQIARLGAGIAGMSAPWGDCPAFTGLRGVEPGSLAAVWHEFVGAWADRGIARRHVRRARAVATRARAAVAAEHAEYRFTAAMRALCRRPEFISRREVYRLVGKRRAAQRRREAARADELRERADELRERWRGLLAQVGEADRCQAATAPRARRRRNRGPQLSEDHLHQALGYALAECGAGPLPVQFRHRPGAAPPPWRGARRIDPMHVEFSHFFAVLRSRTLHHLIPLLEGETSGDAPREQTARERALRAYLRGARSDRETALLIGIKSPGAVRKAAACLRAADERGREETLPRTCGTRRAVRRGIPRS